MFGLGKISDEQYVDRTRKRLRTLHRWRYVIALAYLGIIIGFIVLALQAVHLIGGLATMLEGTKHRAAASGPDLQMLHAVYYFAIVIGGLVGFGFGGAFFSIANILITYRKDKLLVEFWDALSDAEKARLRQTIS